MSVVNCKVAHIRPQWQTLAEWIEDHDNIYIGRANIVFIGNRRYPPNGSPFANPFTIKDYGRDGALVRYEQWIRRELAAKPELAEQLLKCRGKRLGCWCAPEPCHGNILLKIIEELAAKK